MSIDKYEYVSNYHPPTFPDGLDVEGARFDILKKFGNLQQKFLMRESILFHIFGITLQNLIEKL